MTTSKTTRAGDSARKQRLIIPTILIVEEDDDVRRCAIDIAGAAGYIVKVARNAGRRRASCVAWAASPSC